MSFFSGIWLTVASAPSNLGFNPWSWLKYIFTWAVERSFDLTKVIGLPSYALAIFFFTIIIKILLQPAMTKQQRSMRQMGKLQPQLQELQKKYGNDKQKLQQETMKLYQKMGISPFAGCLPLLIQMPILIALFQALRGFVPAFPQYYGFFWIAPPVYNTAQAIWQGGLSAPDPTGWMLPVLTGVAAFFQQYVSITNKSDQTQKMMLFLMPIMFGWFARSFPAFLALYWTYYSIVGGLIQLWLNKRWALEDARAEAEEQAREEEERKQKKIKKAEQKGQVFVEEAEEEKPGNIVTVGGVEYTLPHGYTLRDKKVKAHPYSEEEETLTVVVLPDGREKPLTSLKRNDPPANVPSFGFGLGQKKK